MKKAPKLLVEGVYQKNGQYVRAWREKRVIVVQVWNKGIPEGGPDGDWAMPSVLGLETAVSRAMTQTRERG